MIEESRAATAYVYRPYRPSTTDVDLTGREVQLLRLLDLGLQNKEIAESLSITLGTTKQYLNRLFSKLGVRNRMQAVSAGRRMHLVA